MTKGEQLKPTLQNTWTSSDIKLCTCAQTSWAPEVKPQLFTMLGMLFGISRGNYWWALSLETSGIWAWQREWEQNLIIAFFSPTFLWHQYSIIASCPQGVCTLWHLHMCSVTLHAYPQSMKLLEICASIWCGMVDLQCRKLAILGTLSIDMCCSDLESVTVEMWGMYFLVSFTSVLGKQIREVGVCQ